MFGYAKANISAVTSRNDDKLVICHDDINLDISEIKKRIAQNFKLNANVIHFMHMEEIPRKNGGKVDFKRLA